MMWEQYSI